MMDLKTLARKSLVIILVLTLVLIIYLIIKISYPAKELAVTKELVRSNVRPGVEVFLKKHLDLVRGKRVGLITNPSGVDRQLKSTAWLLKNNPEIKLVALYGPEHGIRGNAQAGEYVPFYIDEKFQLPVFSLYGQSFQPEPGMLKNIDQYMRSFDTQIAGKIPEKSMVGDIEVMILDLQDVGTRVYTYLATMAYALE
ncbi:MAG: exo-beta-N-acetylmuramidase NamZ domain-containing protein, partial [Candidatus Saccharicenans sp.]